MTPESQIEKNEIPSNVEGKGRSESKSEDILCAHCLRTATNGIKCQGMCVADSDY